MSRRRSVDHTSRPAESSQYFLCALHGDIPAEHLLHYRAANSKLPGHPELGLTPGVKFSSGRLGHMWPLVNGVALANKDKVTFCLGSDGSFQEGDDAEAARLAVAKGLNVKFLCDDNDVTIAGHPSDYLKGYSMAKTLEGHGVKVIETEGENIDMLFSAVAEAIATPGPVAVISKRKMAPGVPGLEGSPHGHEVIAVDKAIPYLESRGVKGAEEILKSIKPAPVPYIYEGSSKDYAANRSEFGNAVVKVLDKAGAEKRKDVMVIDSDLEGSTGLKAIHKAYPECFVSSGIMERGNFSAAAGFGFAPDKFGVFSTFAAFLEMCISEITMARLNHCNVLSHFSRAWGKIVFSLTHADSGVDEMADNTCHFGINNVSLASLATVDFRSSSLTTVCPTSSPSSTSLRMRRRCTPSSTASSSSTAFASSSRRDPRSPTSSRRAPRSDSTATSTSSSLESTRSSARAPTATLSRSVR